MLICSANIRDLYKYFPRWERSMLKLMLSSFACCVARVFFISFHFGWLACGAGGRRSPSRGTAHGAQKLSKCIRAAFAFPVSAVKRRLTLDLTRTVMHEMQAILMVYNVLELSSLVVCSAERTQSPYFGWQQQQDRTGERQTCYSDTNKSINQSKFLRTLFTSQLSRSDKEKHFTVATSWRSFRSNLE